MATVVFTPNIQRLVVCPDAEAAGKTVREVLDNVFAENPQARSYVLDDQAGLRKHMTIFVDGQMIRDRARLSDPVRDASTVYVFQALSGGCRWVIRFSWRPAKVCSRCRVGPVDGTSPPPISWATMFL